MLPRVSAPIAFGLSSLWPGLGHLYLRDRRSAALLGLPLVALLAPLLLTVPRGATGLIGYLIVPQNAAILTLIVAISLSLRLLSFWLVRNRFGAAVTRAHGRLIVGLLICLTIAHLIAGYAAVGLFGVTSRVFSGAINPPTTTVVESSPDVGSLPSAGVVTGTKDPFAILVVGSDFGTGYSHSLTDTMIVVSVDPATSAVVMVSMPRDTARFPMFNGGVYDGKLNSLMSRAIANPSQYPEGGLGTLSHEISYLVGIPIQYVAYINLGGFGKLIDVVGGVDVVVTKAIDDNFYQFPNGPKGFHLAAGPQHLDSAHAVAYVRSRYGLGDNDFTRARRQQELLLALKTKLMSPAVLPKLPSLLEELSHLVSTNFPAERVGDMLELSRQLEADVVQHVVLGPPYAINPPGGGEYVLVPDMKRIAKWSIKTFGQLSQYYAAP